MTYFLNLRSHAVGGWLDSAAIPKIQLDPLATVEGFTQNLATLPQFKTDMRGQHVLIGTHGFNVDYVNGAGQLSYWGSLLQLPPGSAFVGLLWPGDSVWAHGLDYPEEPKVADETGEKLGPLLDDWLADAASVSFVSHSLGARVVLQTANQMKLQPARMMLMAGAIDDDCLNKEFKTAAGGVGAISVLASKKDAVLGLAFPLGNLVAGIIDQGHPWWRGALGRSGPSKPRPANFRAPFEIPNNWEYGHQHYLQDDPKAGGQIAIPADVPKNGSPKPLLDADGDPVPGWQEAFSAAFVSTRIR